MKKLFVLMVALAMAFAALPAFAQDKADWAFYGNARMWTSWESVDSNTLSVLSTTAAPSNTQPFGGSGTRSAAWTAAGVNQDDSDLDWKLQSNSRIGANVKWGNIAGRFEYGSSPNLRLLYGTWNFGPGTLLVGQDYTPWFYLVSGMCGPGGGECNGIGQGSIYGGRNPQLKLIMGGFNFALVSPYTSIQPLTFTAPTATSLGTPYAAALTTPDLDQTLPRIEASYRFTLGPAGLWVGGYYNTYDYEFVAAGALRDTSVDAFGLGFGFTSAFGPLYVNGTFTYQQNPNNGQGPYAAVLPSVYLYDVASGNDSDADYYSAQLILGFKVMDMLTLEGGVVWQNGKQDQPSAAGVEIKQTTWAYYIQAVISPAKNVFIIPELGMIDYNKLEYSGQADRDLGDLTYFGVKWQISF